MRSVFILLLPLTLMGCGGSSESVSSSGANTGGDGIGPITDFPDDLVIGGGVCPVSGPLTLPATPLPGPAVLYSDPPVAPQLENRNSRFRAAPILVAHHEAYVNGEYLYQDALFDDYGSETSGSPASLAVLTAPPTGNSTLDGFNANAGDITYPSNFDRYAGNAADLVEFRIAPTPDDIAYRITLNALQEADTTMIAIAWNQNPSTTLAAELAPLSRDAGVNFLGIDEVIYIFGSGAVHSDEAGTDTDLTANMTVDLEANQITLIVPRSLHNPSGVWEATVAVGLHNGSGGWLFPGGSATATAPGGAAPADPTPSAIFNVGFRFDEPYLSVNGPPDIQQSFQLRQKDITPFRHSIDFDKLANGVNETTVVNSGVQHRIFASRLNEPAGRVLGDMSTTGSDFVEFGGQLQPYSIYIPSNYDANVGNKLTFAGHSLGQYHWQYNGTQYVQQIGENRDSLVVTPLSRTRAGFYIGRNEYDFFEVWNDVNRNFNVDMDRVAFTGYSMGGHFTYRMTSLYPDLTGAAFSQVGPPAAGIWDGFTTTNTIDYATLTNLWLENVRNVPFYNMAAITDELVPPPGPRYQNLGGSPDANVRGLDTLGFRFIYQEFATGEHFTLFFHDNYPDSTAFLGESLIDRNPRRVSFSYVPDTDDTGLGLIHDKAYWVSHMQLRDAAPNGNLPAKGSIDAVSLAFGQAEPVSTAATPDPSGTLTGNTGILSYTQYERSWDAPASVTAENTLQASFINLASVQIDAARAGLDTSIVLQVESSADAETELNIQGVFSVNSTVFEDGLPYCAAIVGPQGARIPVRAGAHVYSIVP